MYDRHGQAVDDAGVVADSLAQPEAFGALFHRHGAAIHRYVARRLGTEAADDITAETFLAAFRARGTYDLSRPNALPWLYGIAGNLIAKQHRAEVRALRALARSGHDAVSYSWADRSDSRVSAQAVQGALAEALADLSKGDRHVLLLVAWADLSYLEVAEALSIPVGTVRSRLNRARKKVRAAFGGQDPTAVYDLRELMSVG
ncbi:RNA polymerase sigma factor [Streptomyces sp. NPDC127084]|uniref:RNA polymerase sigma factor n=1 Tax=Streptomyces sp. NPDC127084 TaxID=3347133 RepID=UPI00364F1339